jgi:hypothetical protein
MNVDEAMAKWKELRELYNWPKYPPTLADFLVAEIERLRELADVKADRDSWRRVCEKETEAKHQAWAELAAAKADLAIVDATVAENELLRVTNQRLAEDLAAAKAASVVPVEVVDCYSVGNYLGVECKCEDDADRLSGWIRDRMKERGKG